MKLRIYSLGICICQVLQAISHHRSANFKGCSVNIEACVQWFPFLELSTFRFQTMQVLLFGPKQRKTMENPAKFPIDFSKTSPKLPRLASMDNLFEIAPFPVELAAPRAYWLKQPLVQSGGPMVLDPRQIFYQRDFAKPMEGTRGGLGILQADLPWLVNPDCLWHVVWLTLCHGIEYR